MVEGRIVAKKDDDPQKWILQEHTRVKHELLDKYLGGWLPILGSQNKRLAVIDGFAGRGEYNDGSVGSPVIIIRKAEELISQGRVSEVVCVLVEKNKDNAKALEKVLNANKSKNEGIKVRGPLNQDFEESAIELIESVNGNMIPSFWLIDPFGFSGMSFDTVKKIMSMKQSEVFINLMLRDISRFLTHPKLDDLFDDLFGTREWRRIVMQKTKGIAKEQQLRDLYVAQLRKIGCKVTTFRVCMDEKVQTLYYMIHATKHPKGRWLMKDVMDKQGANGVFAYLGPTDNIAKSQKPLLPSESASTLEKDLMVKFSKRKISFDKLTDECCDDNELRIPAYRKSLQNLRRENKIDVIPVDSKTNRGLKGKDIIIFP